MSLENKLILNQSLTLSLLVKVVETLDIGVIIANPLGEFIMWNEKADSIFEREISRGSDFKSAYKVYDLDGKLISPEFTPMGIAMRGSEVHNKKVLVKGGKNVQGVYVELSSKPVMDEYGEVCAAYVTIIDITKQQMFWNEFLGWIKDKEQYIKESLGVDYERLKKKYYLGHHE